MSLTRQLTRGLPNEGSIVRSEWRTYRLFKTPSIDLDRICECTQARFGRVRHVPDHLRIPKERIVESLSDMQNSGDRYYAVEPIEPVAGRLLSKFAIQNLRQLVTIDMAQGQSFEPLIRLQVRPANGIGELKPEFVRHAHYKDPPVSRRKCLYRREGVMRAAMLPAQMQPVIEIPGCSVSQLMDGNVEQARVHVAPFSSRSSLNDCCQKTKRGGKSGRLIDHGRRADPRRGPFGLTREMHQARLRLHQIVVAWPGGPRVVAPISREVDADNRGLVLSEACVVEAHFRGQVAAKVVHEGIGSHCQLQKRRSAVLRPQVERDTLLVQIEDLKILTVIVTEKIRAGFAGRVAAYSCVLDFDDFCAEIGQQHRSIRSRAELFDRDNPHSAEGIHTGFRLMNCLEIMIRCISFVPSPIQVRGASR